MNSQISKVDVTKDFMMRKIEGESPKDRNRRLAKERYWIKKAQMENDGEKPASIYSVKFCEEQVRKCEKRLEYHKNNLEKAIIVSKRKKLEEKVNEIIDNYSLSE